MEEIRPMDDRLPYYPSLWTLPISGEGKLDKGWLNLDHPIGDILEAHPLSYAYLEAHRSKRTIELRDVRYPYIYRRVFPDNFVYTAGMSPSASQFDDREEMEQYRPYALDFASRFYGGLDAVWQEFLDDVIAYGGVAS